MAVSLLRWMVTTTIVLLLSAVPRPGHAELAYELRAGSSVGASDNPRAQSETAAQVDGFVTAQGYLDLSHIGRLTLDRVSYGVMGTSWFRHSQRSSVTQTLRLSSEIQTGPATKITLNAGGMLTRLSMLDMVAPTDPQTAGPRPSGDQYFVGVDAGEFLTVQWRESWLLDQGLSGRLYRSLDNADASVDRKSATLSAGINHIWARDWAGLHTRFGAMTSSRTVSRTETTETEQISSTFAELLLNWRHEWTPEIRHTLAGGVFALRTEKTVLLPAGSASLQWYRTGYAVELRAVNTVDSNAYVDAAFQRRLVGLQITLPIDKFERLRARAYASLEHDTIAETSTSVGGSANVVLAQGNVEWLPGDLFVFGLQYSFRYQKASDTDGNASRFSTFRRQMAIFTIGMRYPPRREIP